MRILTGVGAVGTVLFGVFRLSEPMTSTKAICVFLIIVGAVGLKFF